MKGYINIIGDIGESFKGVTLKDIVAQVQTQKEATEFDIIVNSGGGEVDEGFKIYNYLKSLNKPLTTIGVEIVASIATIIYASGDTRVLRPNTDFMIHLPSGGVQGTASDISLYARDMRDCQNRIANFYKEQLNLTNEAIFPLLEAETWLKPDEAVSFGFATSIGEPIIAKANINKQTNNMNFTEEDKSWFEKTFNKILGNKKVIANYTKTTSDGLILDFPELEGGDPIEVGVRATVDGQQAQGEILMPGGEIYVFERGELVEKREAPTNADDDNLDKDKQIADLKEDLLEKDEELVRLREELREVRGDMSNMTKEVYDLKKNITSRFDNSKKEPIHNKAKENEPTKRKLFKD